MSKNPWDGDGLPEQDEDVILLLEVDLGCLPVEVHALVDACKSEAWVYEKLGTHHRKEGEEKEAQKCLEISRYFWRRTERLHQIEKIVKEKDGTDVRE